MVTRGKATETDCAYAAGILDGEGSISLRKIRPSGAAKSTVYTATVDVGSTDMALIEWFVNTFGGNSYSAKPSQEHYKPVRRWNVSAWMAAEFLHCVLPYLKIKRPQAETLIEFIERRISSRPRSGQTGRVQRVPDDELARRDALWQRMRTLNHPQRLSEMTPQPEEHLWTLDMERGVMIRED